MYYQNRYKTIDKLTDNNKYYKHVQQDSDIRTAV